MDWFISIGGITKKALRFFHFGFCPWLIPITDTIKKTIGDYYFLLPKSNIGFCLLLCSQLPQYVLWYVTMILLCSMILPKRLYKNIIFLPIAFDPFLCSDIKRFWLLFKIYLFVNFSTAVNRALECPELRDLLAISLFCLCLLTFFRWLFGLKLRLTVLIGHCRDINRLQKLWLSP